MAVSDDELKALRDEIGGADAAATLAWASERFAGRVVFLSSLGVEDQVVTDLIARSGLSIPIATLDTGRLFQETYDLVATTERRLGVKISVHSPDREAVEAFVSRYGINGFRESLEARHACCAARKLTALRRALDGRDLWICGLRRSQSVTRTALEVLERDDANGLLKLSPLAGWSEGEVWDYVKERKVPYNPLHDAGYPSIGCACCTRAVKRTEDVRAGRWWWESADHKECGLHRRV